MKKHNDSYLYSGLIGNFLSWFLAVTIISSCEYINGHYAFIKGHGPVIIGLFAGCFWTIRLHAYREAERIVNLKEGQTLNHAKRFFFRLIIAFLIALVPHLYGEGITSQAICMAMAGTLFIGATFWLLFDFFLNSDRGKPLFYVSGWYKSSSADRFFSRWHSPVLWLFSKILLFLIAIWLYELCFKLISHGNN